MGDGANKMPFGGEVVMEQIASGGGGSGTKCMLGGGWW